MKIWLMNHYASDMFFAEGGRHYCFAKYLKRMGHEPVIFCANSKHNSDGVLYFDIEKTWTEKLNEETGVPYVFVKARPYGKSGKDRILNMADFYRNSVKACRQYAKEDGRPDVIIASSVHPLTLLAGIKLGKNLCVKCICEVRDLWPESIVMYSERFSRKNLLIKALYQGEKYIYKKADALIFTMEGGWDYIKERGWDKAISKSKVFHLNNGVDLEKFESDRANYTIDDSDLDNEDLFKVVYAGSIRKVNNLGKLLDIAKKIRDKSIVFLIWGDGDELPSLKERVSKENIANVIFKGRVDKKYVAGITSKADLNFAHNDESPIFRFGLSFNKIFDYFAAGKPVLCDFDAAYNPVIQSGAGTTCRSSDSEAAAREIERYRSMDKETRDSYCRAAAKAAERYDYKNLAAELLQIIDRTAHLG